MSAITTWPPPSLRQRNTAEQTVAQCEDWEVSGQQQSVVGAPPEVVAIVHMAALMYLNDPNHARHLWRRLVSHQQHRQETVGIRAAVEPWYKIVQNQLTHNLPAVWNGLKTLQEMHKNHVCFGVYAKEIEISYRCHLLRGYMSHSSLSAVPNFVLPMLGFRTVDDMRQFLQQNQQGQGGGDEYDGSTSIQSRTNSVSFLESTSTWTA